MKKLINKLMTSFAVALIDHIFSNRELSGMVVDEVITHRTFEREVEQSINHGVEEAMDDFTRNFEVEATSIRNLDSELESFVETYFHDQRIPSDEDEFQMMVEAKVEELLKDKDFRAAHQLPEIKKPAVYDPELDGLPKDVIQETRNQLPIENTAQLDHPVEWPYRPQ